MTMTVRPARRAGYTLLEVLLASVISVLLLGALYVAMDIQLRSAREGREIVERSNVGRFVLLRLTADLGPCLSPLGSPGSSTPSSSGSSSPTTSTPTSGTGSTSAAPPTTTPTTGGGSSSSTTSSSATSSSTTATTGTPGPPLNYGVQGDSGSLVVLVNRPARPTGDPTTQPPDLRRITYWLGDGGLYRLESLQVTGTDDTSTAADDPANILAPEVKSLQFRYFDGSNWQDSWDGTQPGADGVTPQGPPRAIEITLGIGMADPSAPVKTHRHVIAIPAAGGSATTTTTTSP